MGAFIGRKKQLAELTALLERVRSDQGGKPGRALLIRGRRRVGKSRLVEEFLERANVPHVYFTASAQTPNQELRLFCQEAAESSLPRADLFDGVAPDSWESALRLLGAALPENDAGVLVLDELPYLTGADPSLEGTLQKVFDRYLSNRRIFLIGIGSDLGMMEALNAYGRPFHQRASEMVVPALTPHEVGEMLGLAPADAFDAHLITGGLPLVCDEWRAGMSMWEYLEHGLSSSTSALLVSGERALAAEFPAEVQARGVLYAIGSGETTFTNIGQVAGGLGQAPLSRSLRVLTDKRVVGVDCPLSTRRSSLTRYRVADSYLRFWLRFLGPYLGEVDRGRGDLVLNRIRTSWSSWRGRAIEPIVREALGRIGPERLGVAAPVVGSYWTRTNNPELDIVVADSAPVATRLHAVGSIKWHESSPFDEWDLAALQRHRDQIPGATPATRMIVVSRSGCDARGVDAISPADLLTAWDAG